MRRLRAGDLGTFLELAMFLAAMLAAAAALATLAHAQEPAPEPAVTEARPPGSTPGDGPGPSWLAPHYDKGFVLVSAPPEAKLPFRLRLNHVSQFRYTNSLATEKTYTDHFGNEFEVQRRNDVQLVRDVFYFSGHVFDPKLDFNILVFTSSATLVATAAGYVGYKFHPGFALRAGYFSLPSVRSLTGNYPFFHGQDRSLATNYFRGGFTQGVWANGEPLPGINYIAMVGNSLNTLDLKAAQIDNHLAYSLSVWWDLNQFGQEWNDYEFHNAVALRIGAAGTYSREDRLSATTMAAPENNLTYISDGRLLFERGALAPDVTLSLADFYLLAVDAGLKYRGIAINAEMYHRWLNRFEADGPLPLDSMYDWGFEASAGWFVSRFRWEPYLRGSYINGPFRNSGEAVVGVNWYPFATRWVWLTAEVIGVWNSPYFSGYYAYSVGQTGLVVPVQLLLRF